MHRRVVVAVLSDTDLARYPFSAQAGVLVQNLAVTVDQLGDPAFTGVVERAKARVSEAIELGLVSSQTNDLTVEMMSYPVAILLVSVIGDPFLNRRYANAEGKRASRLLEKESDAKLLLLATDSFKWRSLVNPDGDADRHPLLIHFADYLRNAAGFHEGRWKLVNRVLKDGYVRITKADAARLLEVEVENAIRERLSSRIEFTLPEPVRLRVDELRQLVELNRSRMGGEALPKEVIIEAFPPCIRSAYEGMLSGRRASHMERFALTSFLVNIGMDLEDIIKLFTSVSDFDEELTRYQVMHIAGQTGGRTRYTSPTCSTLRTHGICLNPDTLCKGLKHPLVYYRRRLKAINNQAPQRRQRRKSS